MAAIISRCNIKEAMSLEELDREYLPLREKASAVRSYL
jgi:hypothetical protein